MRWARIEHDDERGFTLVELLVVIGIASIVMAVAGSAVINSFQHQRTQIGQAEALSDAKITLERVTRDLRGAHRLVVTDDREVELEIVRDGRVRTVTILAIPAGDLHILRMAEVTRDEVTGAIEPGSQRSQDLHERLVLADDDPLFRYIVDDEGVIVAIAIDLEILPEHGTNTILIRNEITLRNPGS